MQEWEYDAMPAIDNSLTEWDKLKGLFGSVGRDGWELISVDNGIAYFKRPINEAARNCERVRWSEDIGWYMKEDERQKPLIDAVGKPLDNID